MQNTQAFTSAPPQLAASCVDCMEVEEEKTAAEEEPLAARLPAAPSAALPTQPIASHEASCVDHMEAEEPPTAATARNVPSPLRQHAAVPLTPLAQHGTSTHGLAVPHEEEPAAISHSTALLLHSTEPAADSRLQGRSADDVRHPLSTPRAPLSPNSLSQLHMGAVAGAAIRNTPPADGGLLRSGSAGAGKVPMAATAARGVKAARSSAVAAPAAPASLKAITKFTSK